MDTTSNTVPDGFVPYAYAPPVAPARDSPRAGAALIVIDLLGLLGALISGFALFAHGWVHASIVFPMPGRAADFVARTFGLDVDRELARVANEQVSKVLPPTLWQYGGRAFQWAFVLLVLVAVLLLVALFVARLRIGAQVLAVFAAAGAVTLIVSTLLQMHQQSESLPVQVAKAAGQSAVVNRAFAAATGKPELVITIGWPLYAGALGLIVMVLAVIVGMIIAATRRTK